MNKMETDKLKKTKKCKRLKTESECLSRPDCLFNKSKKCQKKPTPQEKLQKTPTSLESVVSIESVHKDTEPPYEEPYRASEEKAPVISRITSTPISLKTPNIDHITGCHQELEQVRDNLKAVRQQYDRKVSECEEVMFGKFIEKYFNKETDKLTHKDLLRGLQKYYVEEKEKDINFVLSMQEFIEMFSQKTPVKGSNYKRQHVFEAICRLLVLFNYDNDVLGSNKRFYKSLESYIKGTKHIINGTILDMKVNEGSGAGIVDIFFKSNRNKIDNSDLWACEVTKLSQNNEEQQEETEDEYVLIQNKYYDKEKSNISNYDVTRIYTLYDATQKESQKFNGKKRIILMVNNGDAVSSNLMKAKQQYPGLLDSKYGIIGISLLDTWFQKLLFDLYTRKSFNKFQMYSEVDKKNNNELQVRFHQKFVIDATNNFIEREKVSKFIWGAVPRSGKSYMIGGLISERLKRGSSNDVVIILGALTETLKQFQDMFDAYSDFSDYKIITTESNKKTYEEKRLNIYLLSQEWLKDKVDTTKINKNIDPSMSMFKETIKTAFPKLFEKAKIDLYFDEVHKGGSTDISESIIHSFNSSNVSIDIFVMVTATFAKPTLRYENVNFIGDGNSKTETIEWNYNDQQNMKSLTDETKKQMMIHSREGIQQEVLNNVFTHYQMYYGYEYLNVLSSEYQKHPELVLISPECITISGHSESGIPSSIDPRHVFIENLKCSACEPHKDSSFYRNPANIFKQTGPVSDLLNFIGNHIYNYFQATLKYPIDGPHTELWFLPDKHLYGTDTECREVCKQVETDNAVDEDATDNKSIPNIEPLTRGLSIMIAKNRFFSRYNVLIVHNTKLTYLGSSINGKVIFDEFKDFNIDGKERSNERIKLFDFQSKKQTSLSEQIKEFEKHSYANGKSLIVLTGAKLRLGISLPCADIAFNFDDIKSVDSNYQTMFRVLTERTKPELKKYGYYLDFNKSRSIQFIYEYNKIYGEAKKLQTKESLEALQSLLFTFNYNGLNLISRKADEELTLYNTLIDTLELNEAGYTKFWSSKTNIVNLIKKTLASSGNLQLLQKLKKYLRHSSAKKQDKIKNILVEGEDKTVLPHLEVEPQKEEEDQPEQEPMSENSEDYGELINTIAEELPTIIALLALFSNDANYNCNTIEECLYRNLQNIEEAKEQCNCTNEQDSSILDCYLNSPDLITGKYKYNTEILTRIISILLELLNGEQSELLHNNLNFIFESIKKLMATGDGLINTMTDKEVEEKIEQYLSVRTEEKDKYGEVFTPVSLIQEMLDKLPDSVWSNPDLKWLDPANGIGNFPMVVYKKLMKGLEHAIPNEQQRSTHIIENMLYMIELNPKNVKISRKIFGSNANICCANFLENTEKCFREFETSKFDVIIGNPPYNKDGVGKGGGVFWKFFVFKSFELLNDTGFLLFIHPPGWRKPVGERSSAGDVFEEFKKHNLLFVKISDAKIPHFPTVDYYVVQKNAPKRETHVINKFENINFEGRLNLYNLSFIPHLINDESFMILRKLFNKPGEKFNIIRDQSFQPKKEDMTKEGIPHAYYYDPTIVDYLNVYKNYKSIPEYINKNKVVLTYSNGKKKGLLYPKYYDTPIGTTSNTMYQTTIEHDNIQSFITLFNSELIRFLLKITQFSESPNHKNEFKILNMISKPTANLMTDNDVYQYYRLTKKEIHLIKKVLKINYTEDETATKIQAITRGHQTRKKINNLKKGIVKLQAVTRGKLARKKQKPIQRTKKTNKGGKRKTLKRAVS